MDNFQHAEVTNDFCDIKYYPLSNSAQKPSKFYVCAAFVFLIIR